MSGEQFTQVRRPVSRLAEKVLGWLSWVFLLLLTVITMFIALVSFSSETSIQNLETTLNGNDFVQQILASNSLNTTQFVIWLQNGVWAVIVYFIVCLLLSFLALISMNIRILSGFLFLIATVVTLPLVLLFVPLIIPILFFIVAIMMFARKDKIDAVPTYYNEGYQGRYADYEQPSQPSPQYYEKEQSSGTEQQATYDNQLRRGGYTSEVAEKVNGDNQTSEDEPQVLSRQAKYNYKQKQQDESQNANDEFGNVSNVYDEQGYSEADYKQQQEDKEEKRRRQQAEAEEAARLKQDKAEEKARIKQEKKERRKREKEKRKQQPSAVNQRRQNFEERKKMTSNETKTSKNAEQTENTEQQNNDKS
ncbi:lipoteichoic acid stability factor AuxB [Staphylococcus caeli]|uniref:lipoteichoic acid stability factor AuxB n=1 Tax=Staphylococcus caeli TaxID=2201815 RepID=UPI003F54E168